MTGITFNLTSGMAEQQLQTDLQLLELMRQDDAAAFREIYDRYQGLLYAYAYRRLQMKEEARDVVQEVFIVLWENRKDFVLKTYLSGYLYKSVLNRILDIWKHNQVVRRHVLSQPLDIDIDTLETDYLIREKDILALVEKEIANMPPRMRQVYQLRYKQYLTAKQIAAELGISEHTVTTQLQRATSQLKNKLGIVVFVMHLLSR